MTSASSASATAATSRRDRRRAATRSRRVVRRIGLTLGVALGVGAMAATTASAAVPGTLPIMQRASVMTVATGNAEPLSAISQNASDARDAARAAVTEAAATTDEVAGAGLPVEGDTTIETDALEDRIAGFDDIELMPALLVPDLTDRLSAATEEVQTASADLRGRLDAAKAQKAAEEEAARLAAEQAAAEAAAEAERQAEAERAAEARSSSGASGSSAPISASAPASGDNSPAGAQQSARSMFGDYGWGEDQFGCLVSLWNKESGWNYQAYNRGSGAFGIPQALPGDKMASAGGDWQSSAATQVAWGLGYISGRYGTPCGAWDHSQSVGWY